MFIAHSRSGGGLKEVLLTAVEPLYGGLGKGLEQDGPEVPVIGLVYGGARDRTSTPSHRPAGGPPIPDAIRLSPVYRAL